MGTIIHRLKYFPKLPYLLGGNIIDPICLAIPMTGNCFVDRHRLLYGIDCSGLLYYVTNGFTPRNTSQIKNFGNRVKALQPLDLIWFEGHVIIYLGGGYVIESREIDGVIVSKWEERKKKIPKPYTFIRWHPQAFC